MSVEGEVSESDSIDIRQMPTHSLQKVGQGELTTPAAVTMFRTASVVRALRSAIVVSRSKKPFQVIIANCAAQGRRLKKAGKPRGFEKGVRATGGWRHRLGNFGLDAAEA